MSEITLERVVELIRREMRGKMPETEISEKTRLEDLSLSSLQIAEIVFSLEEEHDIEFDESRAAEVKTLGDVIALANEALRVADGPVEEAI